MRKASVRVQTTAVGWRARAHASVRRQAQDTALCQLHLWIGTLVERAKFSQQHQQAPSKQAAAAHP